jgi:hypothetical protein
MTNTNNTNNRSEFTELFILHCTLTDQLLEEIEASLS